MPGMGAARTESRDCRIKHTTKHMWSSTDGLSLEPKLHGYVVCPSGNVSQWLSSMDFGGKRRTRFKSLLFHLLPE